MARAGSSRQPLLGGSGGSASRSGSSLPQARPFPADDQPRMPPPHALRVRPRLPLARSYAAVTRTSPGGLLKPTQPGSHQVEVGPTVRGPRSEIHEGSGSKAVPMEGEGSRSHWNLLRESLYSLFVDHIPVGKDAKWLRALFSKEGRVMDAFIPIRWRRGSNTRFGFVRYRSRVEAIDAVRGLNGLRVGNGRLEVKLADNGGKPSQDSRGIKFREGNGFVLRNQATENVRKWRPKQAEAQVDGGRPAENSSAHIKRDMISLDVIPENEIWLKLCVVGELKEHVSVEQLKEELRNHDIGFYKVFPMAGQRMMINFSTQEEMDKFLSENYPLVLKRFSKIHQWQEDAMPKSRLIWISVTGLPFKAWSESNYAKLAAPFGRYLRRDDRSKQFTGLDRARFLVETTLIGSISRTIEAEIGGKVYQLGVFEDCFLSGCETEGFLRDESSEEQEKNSSSKDDSIEITSKRQESDERVAETQSENAVGEGNGSTKLNSVAIVTNMERPRNSKEGNGCEVDELEERLSEDDSLMSLEKIQNRLKVLRRKTAKDKEVVKYRRRMVRRGDKTQKAVSVSHQRAQEGEIERVSQRRDEEKGGKSEDELKKERILREEARQTFLFAKSLGVARHENEEEAIQQLLNLN